MKYSFFSVYSTLKYVLPEPLFSVKNTLKVTKPFSVLIIVSKKSICADAHEKTGPWKGISIFGTNTLFINFKSYKYSI